MRFWSQRKYKIRLINLIIIFQLSRGFLVRPMVSVVKMDALP